MRARSWRITGSIAGRTTLATTLVPSCRVAACTCATEAEAMGVDSKLANSSLTGLPRAVSIIATDSFSGNGGTSSCSRASSSAMSSGSRSRRVDSSCPNLMNTGPRSSRALRRRTPLGRSGGEVKRQGFSASRALGTGDSRSGWINSSSRYLPATRIIRPSLPSRDTVFSPPYPGGDGVARYVMPGDPPAVPDPVRPGRSLRAQVAAG